MSQPLKLPLVEHFDFSALPLVQVRETFARIENGAKVVYAGVQFDRWQKDELCWSERKGAWSNFVPEPKDPETDDFDNNPLDMRSVAAGLNLVGATLEEFVLPPDFARDDGRGQAQTEPLLRVASGAVLVAQSSLNYAPSATDYFPATAREWLLFNAQSGHLTTQAGSDGRLGSVSDGSYLLWASAGNEWSAIRVVIGGGAWECAPGVIPSPGASLYRKTGATTATVSAQNETQFAVAFDPLARVVSASCVLERDIRTKAGQFDLPAGTLILGGIRASRGGPMSAIWALREDGTARLLAASKTFSTGMCECAKTNHFASDINQHPDGRLFVLSECSLDLYDPDAPSVFERLTPFPVSSGGHPGGNCLRFPSGEVCFWTENFGGVNDGRAWYNRLVRRIAGRDVAGPSTLWHGPNCAEMYLGRFWAIRSDDGQSLYLDWLDAGRWHYFEGMARQTLVQKWQRLRRCKTRLFLFGYAPFGTGEGNETPVCAVADGKSLRDAVLPFFVRRATASGLGDDGETLLLAARRAEDGIGVANRVVEIVQGSGEVRVCSFWDAEQGAFVMSRAAFEDAGGDAAKLSAYFAWRATVGTNGGGVWVASETLPTGPHLETFFSEVQTIRFVVVGSLPYDAAIWGELCFSVLIDGGTEGPDIEPTCGNAACALAAMPDGTKFRVLVRPVPDGDAATAVQLTDSSDEARLTQERDIYPCLWLRVDSDAPREDLSSYRQLVHFGRLIITDFEAHLKIEAVVLVTPQNQPLRADELPILQRRA